MLVVLLYYVLGYMCWILGGESDDVEDWCGQSVEEGGLGVGGFGFLLGGLLCGGFLIWMGFGGIVVVLLLLVVFGCDFFGVFGGGGGEGSVLVLSLCMVVLGVGEFCVELGVWCMFFFDDLECELVEFVSFVFDDV